jgi:tRNA(Ile)-lysidine synthase
VLPAQIQRSIEKFRMFDRTARILVGVSGGADSVCLLLVLNDLGYNVAAAHLNHGLRGAESDADEQFVRELAERLTVPFHCRRVNLPIARGNVEAAGRQARKDFFAALVAEYGFDRVALAHNQNDRVETFLLNLFRGAGGDGLTSMEPVVDHIVRPLIEVPRSKIEWYLEELGAEWRLDATNLDSGFTRNRVRLNVIPELMRTFNPNLVAAVARTTEILSDENAALAEFVEDWLRRHGAMRNGAYVLDSLTLAAESVAIQRRVVRAALKRIQQEKPLNDVGFDHIEAAIGLLKPQQSGKKVEFPGGAAMSRSFDSLIVELDGEPVEDFEYELQIPGEIHIPELNRCFRATIVEESENFAGYSSERVLADGDDLGQYVRIRNWKPGDYYRPVGLPAGKLKKLFQRARIPRNQRHRWPVFVADSSIIWVASFPISREFAPRGRCQRIVAFEASPI